ncbi:hypothetical protein KP509_25G068600 [Ceratopteris richardii]|uniref:DUF7866 domain-containing protein n=1 Tax=Ceratopteris richardii TaxID=49495 RepID=A0A8T2RRD9_CERRI|nr:hypothetical protein KP509_25G068600 [Ceratopteris richardii]
MTRLLLVLLMLWVRSSCDFFRCCGVVLVAASSVDNHPLGAHNRQSHHHPHNPRQREHHDFIFLEETYTGQVTKRIKLKNGTIIELHPPIGSHVKVDDLGSANYMSRKERKSSPWRGEKIFGRHGFHICARCRCCNSSGVLCLKLPCCFSITCNAANQPFGQCSLIPFSCNCFTC